MQIFRNSAILYVLLSSPLLASKGEADALSLGGLQNNETPSRSIFSKDRFDIALSYSALVQGALGEGESGGSGEAAFSGRYVFVDETYPSRLLNKLGVESDGSLSLKFRFRQRHKLLDISAAELALPIGSILGTTDGFSNSGFEIPDFYIQHVFHQGKVELRYGQITVESRIDGHALRSAKTAFLNRVFSTNPTVAFPRFGAGATTRWQVNDHFSLTGVLTQVQASKAGTQVDFDLNASDLFTGLQFDYEWGDEEKLSNSLQLLFWGADATDELKEDFGFSATFEQHYTGLDRSIFARIASSQGQQTDLDMMGVVGIGQTMREKDLIGIGTGVGHSSEKGRTQAVLEAFYRYQAPFGLQITPDVQLLIGDGLDGDFDFVAGLRGHIYF
ncbi:carbohydrate porin [Rubritalea spongiae]|uniref:Carbohydrate porin n=1 Tax=Rubritalea spongiae TaxID=430797 RepID=A0ABW5E4L6_9BACT